jgi:hypothetical protein
MRPLFRASLLERIAAYLRTARGLAVASILWALFLIALVFVFIRLPGWETRPRASAPNSTAASQSANDSGGWTARRLYCSPSQPCDAWSPFSEDVPFSLRFETQPEEVTYTI